MKKVIYLVVLLLSGCSSPKKEEICTAPGVVDNVVWGYSRRGIEKLAYFTFIYDDQVYTFRDDFHAMMKINVGDNVLVQFNCNNPKKKAKCVKLVKRNGSEPKKETKYVRADGGVPRKSYHGVDKKPLFNGVQDYTENDKAVDSYLEKTLKEMNVQEHGKIGISIVIDKEGKVIESKVLHSNNQKLNDIVQTILKDMPLWTPDERKGEKVNVSFLIVLDW
ncbi:hypothetical protein [Bacteroides cellulosilyticus]|uniref:hypothetical protein n=1 Tax=Bacteroides cellulosilyticus TaxID=246787 RepID=UPI00101C7CB8|nr:hypothetical protein [Bacteroides cellulosilyticus]